MVLVGSHSSGKSIPLKNRLRSFSPIYRISSDAVRFLVSELQTGWKGHYEMTFPTLLNLNDYQVLDFGGSSDFSPQKNQFYISRGYENGQLHTGTMRYRPAMREEGFRKNKLYHPVKSDGGISKIRELAGNL